VRAQTSPPCRSALAALSCWAGRRLSHDPQAHGPLPHLGLPTGSLLLAAAAPGARSKPAGAAGQPQHRPVRLQARRACPAPLAALLSVEQSPRAEPEHERRPQAVPCAAARPGTNSPCASGCLACASPGKRCRARAPDPSRTYAHSSHNWPSVSGGPARLAQPWTAGPARARRAAWRAAWRAPTRSAAGRGAARPLESADGARA